MMMMMMMIMIIIIIIITKADNNYRLCKQSDETVEHIISACHILAKEQYIKRHDRACVELHCNIPL
jgi:uncharacterized membrane protein